MNNFKLSKYSAKFFYNCTYLNLYSERVVLVLL